MTYGIATQDTDDSMSDGIDYARIVDEAVQSMELEGFHPTEEDRRLAYLCVTGRISFEEILESVMNEE